MDWEGSMHYGNNHVHTLVG